MVVTSVLCVSHTHVAQFQVRPDLLGVVVRTGHRHHSGAVVLLDLEESATYGLFMEPAVGDYRSQLAAYHFKG